MDKSPAYDIDQLIASGDFDALNPDQQAFVLSTLGSQEAFEILRETLYDLEDEGMPTSASTKANVMDAFDKYHAKDSKVVAPLPSKNPKRLKIAAAVIILLGSAYYFSSLFEGKDHQQLADNQTRKTEKVKEKSAPELDEIVSEKEMDESISGETPIETSSINQKEESESSPTLENLQERFDDQTEFVEAEEEYTAMDAMEPDADMVTESFRTDAAPEKEMADEDSFSSSRMEKSLEMAQSIPQKESNSSDSANDSDVENEIYNSQTRLSADVASPESLQQNAVSRSSKKRKQAQNFAIFKITGPEKDHYTAY